MDDQTLLIAMVSGTIIPLLVGVLTKLRAPSSVKAVCNAFLSAIAGALAMFSADEFRWTPFAVAAFSSWVVSVSTYYGLWKPTGTSASVQQATADVGVGPVRPASP